MELLMPEIVDEAKLPDLQKAMRKDLRIAAKKAAGNEMFFVVANEVPLSDGKKTPLFVAVKREAEAKAWQLKLKGKKVKVLTTGTCTLESKDGKNVAVSIDKVKGDRKVTVKTAKLAFKLDPAVKVSDPEAKSDENETPEAEVEQATIKTAAAALGIDAKEIADILSGELSEAEAEEINALLADPKKLEAEALKMFDDMVGA